MNIPVVEQADLEVLGPFIPLAARLGRLATALVSARPERIVVAAHGPLSEYDTRLLTVAALNGVFQDRVDQTVNYVNAPVIAAERGLDVSEQRFAASQHYTNLVRVVVSGPGEHGLEEIEVSGTTIGPEGRLFLAGALGFAIDIELAPRMAFLVYDDVPGVIGRVGTMFGEAGVNIANMAVSRTKEGGKALMAFSIDSAPPRELVERVDASGFDAAFHRAGLAITRPDIRDARIPVARQPPRRRAASRPLRVHSRSTRAYALGSARGSGLAGARRTGFLLPPRGRCRGSHRGVRRGHSDRRRGGRGSGLRARSDREVARAGIRERPCRRARSRRPARRSGEDREGRGVRVRARRFR